MFVCLQKSNHTKRDGSFKYLNCPDSEIQQGRKQKVYSNIWIKISGFTVFQD